MWNLLAPPGFQGLHPDLPLTVYTRHLPHWRQEGATYFVTFRLADSLPQCKLDELEEMRRESERLHPRRIGADLEEYSREVMKRVERWLDQGIGSCVLRQSRFADLLTQAMHHFDGIRYELDAYVIMPNHAHAILRPTQPEEHPLEAILGSWKQYSGKRINAQTKNKGELWQDESFDRIIRDEEHLYRALQYIGRNPEWAGLKVESCPVWVRPEWAALGWIFEKRTA
jgi:putative transposase